MWGFWDAEFTIGEWIWMVASIFLVVMCLRWLFPAVRLERRNE